jgi:hypothetical protein
MFLIRDVFRCKPGKARELAEKLRATLPWRSACSPSASPGGSSSPRI